MRPTRAFGTLPQLAEAWTLARKPRPKLPIIIQPSVCVWSTVASVHKPTPSVLGTFGSPEILQNLVHSWGHPWFVCGVKAAICLSLVRSLLFSPCLSLDVSFVVLASSLACPTERRQNQTTTPATRNTTERSVKAYPILLGRPFCPPLPSCFRALPLDALSEDPESSLSGRAPDIDMKWRRGAPWLPSAQARVECHSKSHVCTIPKVDSDEHRFDLRRALPNDQGARSFLRRTTHARNRDGGCGN